MLTESDNRLQESSIRSRAALKRYYEMAGPDYEYWSRNMNMHFGVWHRGISVLDREAMLEQTSLEAFTYFNRKSDEAFHALDAGCGVGASLRTAAAFFRNATFAGITVVPWQIERSRSVLTDASRVQTTLADYEETSFPDQSFDICFSIEAAVHGTGLDKRKYLREMHRLLRPGGRLVVVDCFLLHPPESINPFTRMIYRTACEGWAVQEMAVLPAMIDAARELGFSDVRFQDYSFRVAPSVMHVPWVTAKYLIDSVRHGGRTQESLKHVLSCACACLLGPQLHLFRYGIFIAEKPAG
jgi:cyclopropane fatty-acyl-phospholipid synthase-like methyltransferase